MVAAAGQIHVNGRNRAGEGAGGCYGHVRSQGLVRGSGPGVPHALRPSKGCSTGHPFRDLTSSQPNLAGGFALPVLFIPIRARSSPAVRVRRSPAGWLAVKRLHPAPVSLKSQPESAHVAAPGVIPELVEYTFGDLSDSLKAHRLSSILRLNAPTGTDEGFPDAGTLFTEAGNVFRS